MKTNKFSKLDGSKLKIAIVQARFNSQITDSLVRGAMRGLRQAGVSTGKINLFKTPGAFEIPLVCQKLARTRKYHGIITIGAVIKGETAHFDYISQAAISSVMQVMLQENLPIALGIITTYNAGQAKARSRDNQSNKGYEAALALVEMVLKYK
jgi:6,7-dimethyl-8-ribityllumazine synthase